MSRAAELRCFVFLASTYLLLTQHNQTMTNFDAARYNARQNEKGSLLTKAVQDISFFCPETSPKRVGEYVGPAAAADNVPHVKPKMLEPFKLRSLEFKNRIFLSPMAQYR